MKRLGLLIFIVLVFLWGTNTYSQAKFSLGPFIGVTIPAGDYSGTTIDYFNGTQYGLSSGIDIGAIFKVKFPFGNLRFSAGYSPLKNTGFAEPDRPSSYIEVKQSLFTLSAGPEFQFNIPQSPVRPYVGADLLLTSFSGETTFLNVGHGIDNATYSMSSATRLGIGVGAGIEFAFGNKYSLDIGLRYNFHNLLGKSFTSGSNSRVNSYLNLNDDRDPLFPEDQDAHPIGSSRTIATLNLYIGFLFSL